MALLHPGSYPALTAAALSGSLAAIIQHVSVSDAAIFAIAVAAAFASFRTKRTDAVRQNNHDLEDRNRTLEAEKVRDTAEIVRLRAQPNLDVQAQLLTALLEALKRHDENTTSMAQEIVDALKTIKTAVVPPT